MSKGPNPFPLSGVASWEMKSWIWASKEAGSPDLFGEVALEKPPKSVWASCILCEPTPQAGGGKREDQALKGHLPNPHPLPRLEPPS